MFTSMIGWKKRNPLHRVWVRRYREPASRGRVGRQPRIVLCLEELEDRCLLSTYTVSTNQDSGAGSLREAITLANKDPNSTINFDAQKVGGQTISVLSPLPEVTADGITITALDPNGDPESITLDGTNTGSAHGLVLSDNTSSVLGLGIEDFEGAGIKVEGASHIIYKDTIANNGTGVYIFQALDTLISTNTIRKNSGDGITIYQSAGITIKSQDPREGASISGSGENGIRVIGEMENSGRSFVTDISANSIYGNQANGIAGNKSDGIRIAAANNNVISGNRIGTDVTGTVALANQGNGVNISYATATNNTVGGSVAGAANLISGNLQDGVRIALEANANKVLGNLIGTNVNGALPLRNSNGVEIRQAAYNNTIGGGNVTSGNNQSGIVITGSATNFNQVQGNFVGTDKSGLTFLPNLGDGVDVDQGAAHNQIGGTGGVTGGGAGNLISGNLGDGVRITNGASFNVLDGNLIGTNVSSNGPLPNFGHGVFVAFAAQNNTIGGTTPAPGNVIAFNRKAGVAVGFNPSDFTAVHNVILSNSIYANKGLGIDLADNGVTPNSLGGPHVGPNEFQNFPVILDAVASGSVTKVALQLNSIPSTQFTIQLFVAVLDPTGFGQGRLLVATVPLSTDAAGNRKIVVTVPKNLGGAYLTATATAAGPYNETSEFSKDFLVKSSTAGAVTRLSPTIAALDPFGNVKGDQGTAIRPAFFPIDALFIAMGDHRAFEALPMELPSHPVVRPSFDPLLSMGAGSNRGTRASSPRWQPHVKE